MPPQERGRASAEAATASQPAMSRVPPIGADIGKSREPRKSRAPREEWHRVGMDFHIELARLSGNEFLFRAVRDAMTRLSRARWLEVRDEAALGRAWAEHHAILAAVRAGDAGEAAHRLSAHIVGSRDRLVTSLHNDRRGLRARGFAVVAA